MQLYKVNLVNSLPLFRIKTNTYIPAFFKRQLFQFFQFNSNKTLPISCWHSGVCPHQNNHELECPLEGQVAIKVPGTGLPKHSININGIILPTLLSGSIAPPFSKQRIEFQSYLPKGIQEFCTGAKMEPTFLEPSFKLSFLLCPLA